MEQTDKNESTAERNSDWLPALLQNPAVAQKLSEILSSLEASGLSSTDAGQTLPVGTFSPPDPDSLPVLLSRVMPLLKSPPKADPAAGRRDALLLALKPFLTPERQRAVDTILNLSHLGSALGRLEELSGGKTGKEG